MKFDSFESAVLGLIALSAVSLLSIFVVTFTNNERIQRVIQVVMALVAHFVLMHFVGFIAAVTMWALLVVSEMYFAWHMRRDALLGAAAFAVYAPPAPAPVRQKKSAKPDEIVWDWQARHDGQSTRPEARVVHA